MISGSYMRKYVAQIADRKYNRDKYRIIQNYPILVVNQGEQFHTIAT